MVMSVHILTVSSVRLSFKLARVLFGECVMLNFCVFVVDLMGVCQLTFIRKSGWDSNSGRYWMYFCFHIVY